MSLLVFPIEDYDSLASLEDTKECVNKRNPNSEFLKLEEDEQEAILRVYTDLIKNIYLIPSHEDEEVNPCTPCASNKIQCDFKKAICLMILFDCGRGCCNDVKRVDNGVTSTEYFDRGLPKLINDIPLQARAVIADCLKMEYKDVIGWDLV